MRKSRRNMPGRSEGISRFLNALTGTKFPMLFLVIFILLTAEILKFFGMRTINFASVYLLLIVSISFWRGLGYGSSILVIAFISVNQHIFIYNNLYGSFIHKVTSSILNSILFPVLALILGVWLRNTSKAYENELKRTKDMYQILVENQNDLIIKVDAEGRFLYVSPSYCRLFGKKEDELLGTHYMPLVHEDDREITAKAVEKLFQPPHTCYVEQRALTKDGWRWISWTDKAVLDENGTLVAIVAMGREITEKKMAEEQIRISKERYELVFSGVNDGIWDWDILTGEVYHSSRWKHILGYSDADDFSHISSWEQLIHPDDYERIKRATSDYLARQIPTFIAEYRLRTKEGNYKWVLERGQAIWNEEGKAIRMAGSDTDITQRKKAEEELKELSALLKATLDNIPDIIAVVDSNRNIIQSNRAGYEHFNNDVSEVTGKTCCDFIGHRDGYNECITRKAVETKQPVQMEYYLDYANRWLDVRAYPIFNDTGEVAKVIEHIRDITVQKQAEIEVQRSNSILKAQQEASIDGILVVDKEREIVSYNQRFMELWDVSQEVMNDLSSNVLVRYVLPRVVNKEEFLNRVTELYSNPLEFSHEKVHLTNGRILERYSSPVLLSDCEHYGRIWFFRDITEKEETDMAFRKSMEQNSKLLKEVLEYDQLKSEFFSNISHEFRTPINVILGTLQLMNLQNTGLQVSSNNERLKKHTKIMKQNCYRLLRLTNNLIDITKLEAGFSEINLCNCNIIQIVEEITLSVDEYIENKGIELIFDTDTEEKVMAVDADKIERIMLNLLSNAVKFTKKGGAVSVNIADKGECIEISVKDTGIGIPQDKLGIIFERFRQVNSSLTRSHEGSGIGLSLVKKLVELHQGRISVSSEYGKGSEFIIELPAKIVDENVPNTSPSKNKENHVQRINLEFSDIYS